MTGFLSARNTEYRDCCSRHNAETTKNESCWSRLWLRRTTRLAQPVRSHDTPCNQTAHFHVKIMKGSHKNHKRQILNTRWQRISLLTLSCRIAPLFHSLRFHQISIMTISASITRHSYGWQRERTYSTHERIEKANEQEKLTATDCRLESDLSAAYRLVQSLSGSNR